MRRVGVGEGGAVVLYEDGAVALENAVLRRYKKRVLNSMRAWLRPRSARVCERPNIQG